MLECTRSARVDRSDMRNHWIYRGQCLFILNASIFIRSLPAEPRIRSSWEYYLMGRSIDYYFFILSLSSRFHPSCLQNIMLGKPPRLHCGLCAQTNWLSTPPSQLLPFNRTQFSHIFSIWFPSALDRFWSNFMPAKLAVSAKLSWKPEEEKKNILGDRRRAAELWWRTKVLIFMLISTIGHTADSRKTIQLNMCTRCTHRIHSCRHSILGPEQNATAWLHVFCCSVTPDMHKTEDEQKEKEKKKKNTELELRFYYCIQFWMLRTRNVLIQFDPNALPLLSSESNLFKRRTEGLKLWCTKPCIRECGMSREHRTNWMRIIICFFFLFFFFPEYSDFTIPFLRGRRDGCARLFPLKWHSNDLSVYWFGRVCSHPSCVRFVAQ